MTYKPLFWPIFDSTPQPSMNPTIITTDSHSYWMGVQIKQENYSEDQLKRLALNLIDLESSHYAVYRKTIQGHYANHITIRERTENGFSVEVHDGKPSLTTLVVAEHTLYWGTEINVNLNLILHFASARMLADDLHLVDRLVQNEPKDQSTIYCTPAFRRRLFLPSLLTGTKMEFKPVGDIYEVKWEPFYEPAA